MTRNIALTNVHLDLGAPRRGAAVGPAALHHAGIVDALQALGHAVIAQHTVAQDDAADPGHDPRARYVAPIAAVCGDLAELVEQSLQAGRFPLVLGGDHSLAIGSVAGVVRHVRRSGRELGVLWVDAHPDMNTPGTSPSGNLHGMPLAVLLGHGRDALTGITGGAPALAPGHVVLFGVRDIDRDEQWLVQYSGVHVFSRAEIADRGIEVCLADALDLLRPASAGIHLSFDLDACDPAIAPGVATPVAHGFDRGEALAICEQLARSGRLISMELVELDPTLDAGNRTGELAVRLIASALAPGPLVPARSRPPARDPASRRSTAPRGLS